MDPHGSGRRLPSEPEVNSLIHSSGLALLSLSHPSGACASLSLFGATLLSFTTKKGREILRVSSKAILDGKKAIRGGIPLVFPQFGPGPLPQHGFARNSMWEVEESSTSSSGAVATLVLRSSEATLKVWPHVFTLRLTVRLEEDRLHTVLSAENTGWTPFDCQMLQHTYLAIDNIREARVQGLKGLSYVDKMAGGEKKEEKAEFVSINSPTDRVYIHSPDAIKVQTGNAVIHLTKAASLVSPSRPRGYVASDCVVWNPWEGAHEKMADLGEEDYSKFICVEPGIVSSSLSVGPGDKLLLEQTLSCEEA